MLLDRTAPSDRTAPGTGSAPAAPTSAPTSGPAGAAPATGPAAFAVVPVLLVVAAKVAVHAAVLGGYGWHRDELYYLSAGRRPALGYVDMAPVVPWLATVTDRLVGASLVGLRLWAVAAGAAMVVIAALVARELGGGRRSQALAALAVAASPALLGPGAMFQTVVVDQLAWSVVLLVAVRLVVRGTGAGGRRWLALGAAAGVALATKYTVGVLLAALVLGLLATSAGRTRLRCHPRSALAAAALALAVVAPSLWWQADHGWPFLRFIDREVEEDTTLPSTLLQQLLLLGPVGIPLAVLGARGLWRRRGLRPLAVAAGAVVVAFWVLGGRSYYPAPLVVLVLPAAVVALEAALDRRPRWRWALPLALVLPVVALSPTILPVLPVDRMADLGLPAVREDYGEELGWPGIADLVADAWDGLAPAERASAAVLAGNYGVAGAVEHLADGRGLPTPVSAHLTWRWWSDPAALDATTVVTVGLSRAWLDARCAAIDVVGVVDNGLGVDNEEQGGVVTRCRLRTSLRDAWPELLDRGW